MTAIEPTVVPSGDPRKLVPVPKNPGVYRRGRRYVVVVRGADGKQVKRFCRTLAEARAKRADLTANAKRGEEIRETKETVRSYYERWIDTYAGRTSRGLRDSTRDGYRQMMETHVLPALGDVRLSRLRQRDLRELAAALFAKGKSRNTVRLALSPLRAMLASAVEDDELRANPAIGLRLPASPVETSDEETERVKALTEEELRRLLDALPDGWRLLVEFLAHTGLRIGEAAALRWEDVDLGRGRVHVRRRWYRGTFAPPKSKYGRRDVPLTAGMTRALWAARKESGAADGALIFGSSRGTPLDVANVYRRVFKPATKTAGVPWATFHTLRHTCATMLFRHGFNPKQVQGWLGHHAASFTIDTYIHLLPDDLGSAPPAFDTLTRRAAPAADLDRHDLVSVRR